MTAVLTVYYDGACPLCVKEIGFYRRQRGGERIDWVDVSTGPQALTCDDLTCEVALKRFHARRADGGLVDGAAAFGALWLELPAWRFLGRLATAPLLSNLFESLYRLFLIFRPSLQKLAHRLDQKKI